MTRDVLPDLPALLVRSRSVLGPLLLAVGLAGCLEPVAAPQLSRDAGDGSVIFVPDTSAPPKDIFFAELADPDAADSVDAQDADELPDSADTAASDDAATSDAATETSETADDAALPNDATLGNDAASDAHTDGKTADGETAADGAADTSAVDADVDDTAPPQDASGDAALQVDTTTTDAEQDVDVPDAATPVVCGDNVCASAESCAQCPADCGACPEVCGDGSCTASESCDSCEVDCGVCPGPVCEVLTSVGCLPGEQCFPDGSLNLCWTAGTAQYGDPCGALDCALGSLCVGGSCRTLCSTDLNPLMPGCLAGVPCQTLVGPGGPLGPNLGACQTIASCNPWSHNGCPTEQMCVVEGAYKVCALPGAQGPGSACQTSWVCAKGLVCVEGAKGSDPSAPGTCRPACDLAAPACASGTCWPTLGPDAAANPYGLGGCVP